MNGIATGAIPFTADDLDRLVRTADGEARNQGDDGLAAVCWVARTRATWDELTANHPEHEWWGTSIAACCAHPYQFSCWLGGADTAHIEHLAPDSAEYLRVRNIAVGVLDGSIPDPTGGATHYKVAGTKASWDAAVERLGLVGLVIRNQVFYRLGPQG